MTLPTHSKVVIKIVGAAVLAVAAFSLVTSQTIQPTRRDPLKAKVSPERDELWFETNVGSFKILQRGDTFPSGDLTMSFTGTVMISMLNGEVIPSGNVRREYNEPSKQRQVWFGTGSLTIKGSFQAVQWFGRNLKAKFNGNGFVRMYGEFDKNLETGTYWYDPSAKKHWGNYGAGAELPEKRTAQTPGAIKTREEFEKRTGGG